MTSRALSSVLPGLRREHGQTMAEYGVVLSVITLAILAAFSALGIRIVDVLNAAVARLP